MCHTTNRIAVPVLDVRYEKLWRSENVCVANTRHCWHNINIDLLNSLVLHKIYANIFQSVRRTCEQLHHLSSQIIGMVKSVHGDGARHKHIKRLTQAKNEKKNETLHLNTWNVQLKRRLWFEMWFNNAESMSDFVDGKRFKGEPTV